jgi:hypothetical protein
MRNILLITLTLIVNSGFSQTTNGSGRDWTTGSIWSGGTYPGTLTGNALAVNSSSTIVINHYTSMGFYNGTRIDPTFGTGGGGSLTINDWLVIYGNVIFNNNALDLNISDGAVLVIFGNLTLNNKLDLDANGTLIVTGTISKGGSQGEFTGSGKIYAGAYSGPDIDAFIPGTVGDGDDQQQVLDPDLENEEPSLWDFVSGGGVPLPVEFTSFSATVQSGRSFLSWQTATELNNSHFDVERSDNGRDFVKIGQVAGHGTTTEMKNYIFTDSRPVNQLAYYRLRQVDYDGAYEYSKIVVAQANNLSGIQLSVYPNPASDRMFIQTSGPASIHRLELLDISGRLVADLKECIGENDFVTEVPLTGLKPGIYLLTYQTVTNDSGALRVLVR